MGLFNLFKATETSVDQAGLKTTKTISTEDPDVARKFIPGSVKERENVINATFTKNTGSNKKTSKKSAEKALPTPKPKLAKPGTAKKLEPVKKTSTVSKKPGKKELSKKALVGKAEIKYSSNNLNKSQIDMSNHNSMSGTRGTTLKKYYEARRHQIEFSGLTNSQKKKLVDKLYKLYEPILRYDSQYYSWAVSGPARYPGAKMESIVERRMEASQKMLDWWKSIEPILVDSTKSKKRRDSVDLDKKKKEIKEIKESFELYYQRAVNRLPEYQKNNRDISHSSEVALALHYVNLALKVDTNLYKELFQKLDSLCHFRKNTNVYKIYNQVNQGQISATTIQKQEQKDNSLIYQCSDYEIRNLKIDAGKRIAISFLLRPKPQLVYALKKKGFTWYSFKGVWICKPEKFDLEWAKSIKDKYKQYL